MPADSVGWRGVGEELNKEERPGLLILQMQPLLRGAMLWVGIVPPLKQGTSGLHQGPCFGTVLIDTSVVNDEIFMSGFIIVHDKGSRAVVSYYKQTRFTNSHRSLVS